VTFRVEKVPPMTQSRRHPHVVNIDEIAANDENPW
jgi:hypothetical protein